MTNLEPFYNWQNYYIASEDELSPFYGRTYNEYECIHKIYNYYIHPQWDAFGSSTLYLKILFADYNRQFAFIEFIGEWNDCLHNDIMFLKRDVIETLLHNGIRKFVLIGENVLNFHASDDCYYEEWYEEVKDEDGWIMAINFRDHVIDEMNEAGLGQYLLVGKSFSIPNWRSYKPVNLMQLIHQSTSRFIG